MINFLFTCINLSEDNCYWTLPVTLHHHPALPGLLQLGLDVRLLPGNTGVSWPLSTTLRPRTSLSDIRTTGQILLQLISIISYLALTFSIALVNSVLTTVGSFSISYEDFLSLDGFVRTWSMIAREAERSMSWGNMLVWATKVTKSLWLISLQGTSGKTVSSESNKSENVKSFTFSSRISVISLVLSVTGISPPLLLSRSSNKLLSSWNIAHLRRLLNTTRGSDEACLLPPTSSLIETLSRKTKLGCVKRLLPRLLQSSATFSRMCWVPFAWYRPE